MNRQSGRPEQGAYQCQDNLLPVLTTARAPHEDCQGERQEQSGQQHQGDVPPISVEAVSATPRVHGRGRGCHQPRRAPLELATSRLRPVISHFAEAGTPPTCLGTPVPASDDRPRRNRTARGTANGGPPPRARRPGLIVRRTRWATRPSRQSRPRSGPRRLSPTSSAPLGSPPRWPTACSSTPTRCP